MSDITATKNKRPSKYILDIRSRCFTYKYQDEKDHVFGQIAESLVKVHYSKPPRGDTDVGPFLKRVTTISASVQEYGPDAK